MIIRARTPEETYAPALAVARQQFARSDPIRMAALADVPYLHEETPSGFFAIRFLGAEHEVLWPEGDARQVAVSSPADITAHILLLHYLLMADGTPMANQWIAFRRLPGGMGYDAAFQGRADRRLVQRFGSDRSAFEAAAQALEGERLAFGDASYSFRVLPSLWLAAVLNLADDELPAEASVLFDGAANHYLPTEDLAVLGGTLAGRLIRAARS
jgi:hypothetical protein